MAQDDLRYPDGMVASEHKELPESDLPVGRGSMPGKPLQEIEEDQLISGRGCVP